jgi:hypothetical protein
LVKLVIPKELIVGGVMARMDVKEMHKRLILYKMVRQVVEKGKNNSQWQEIKHTPWLCNVYEGNGGNNIKNVK